MSGRDFRSGETDVAAVGRAAKPAQARREHPHVGLPAVVAINRFDSDTQER